MPVPGPQFPQMDKGEWVVSILSCPLPFQHLLPVCGGTPWPTLRGPEAKGGDRDGCPSWGQRSGAGAWAPG